MRQFIDVTGKTEEEAINRALEQLKLDRDDVSVEILERAKAGFLGLGSCPAKVRVSYGEDEEPAAPAQPKVEKVREDKPKAEKPRAEKKPAEKPQRREEPVKKELAPKTEEAQTVKSPEDLGEEVDDERAQEIRKFLSGLLQQMEVQAEVKVYLPEKGRYKVFLEGQGLGAIIGRRGETLDAIQQLTSYSVNRTGSRVRVQLDAENYRAKREQSLERLANKVAGKVVKYRRSVTLEPMNAYERHVIHTALQDYEGVSTSSTGVEPNRRVVVNYERPAGETEEPRRGNRGERSRRPPLDRVNAMLSFAYSLLAHDCASALESVGPDSYVGFLHRDRPGRQSLALDLMEELRPCMADRFVLTLVNNRMLRPEDFQMQDSGAVLLSDEGRRKFLKTWQERKRDTLTHPYLGEKLSWGMIPYVQALLLARCLRGDLDGYPPFLWK